MRIVVCSPQRQQGTPCSRCGLLCNAPGEMDKTTELLLVALKTALAQPGEHALFKTGKQPGLFASRSGIAGETAHKAIQDGLLEVMRRAAGPHSTIKGAARSEVDWVRITPRGVQFIYEHESPKAVLEELVAVMRATHNGAPQWLDEIRSQFNVLSNRFTDLLEKQCHYLDQLTRRAEAALNRLSGQATAAGEPWQNQLLDYLQQRRIVAGTPDCRLPELFAFARNQNPELSLANFHDGLGRLQDQRLVQLLPFEGPLSELAEPEFALLDGSAVYYAVRAA